MMLFATTASAQGAVESPPVERLELANGVRLVIVHVPGATRQSMFTFLPLSLATDRAGESQWSHLLEHMLIRSTGETGLTFKGGEFNGETLPDCMRLETFCEPGHWREGVARHAKWLAVRAVDEAVLAREKSVIAGEEQSTSATGLTYKFAVAAWNQVARHGRMHAAIHGDVADASIERTLEALRTLVPVDGSVLIATIGPVDPSDVRREVEATIGVLPPATVARDAFRATATPPAGGHIDATWDMGTRHLLVWWKFPAVIPSTRAAAEAFALLVQGRLAFLSSNARRTRAMVHGCLTLPEGAYFMVNALVVEGDDPEAVRQKIIDAVHACAGAPASIVPFGQSLAMQASMMPDFQAMHARLSGRARDMLEAQWLLTTTWQEYCWGCSRAEIAQAFRDLSPEQAEALGVILQEAPTGSLTLTPREGDDAPAPQR